MEKETRPKGSEIICLIKGKKRREGDEETKGNKGEMKRKGNRNGRENERIERTKINKHKGKMKKGRD